jgi:hypothetical protein
MKQPIKKHAKWNSLIELITSPAKKPDSPTPPAKSRSFKEFRQGLVR